MLRIVSILPFNKILRSSFGKQGVQHGNESVVALIRLAAKVDEGDIHHGVFFAGIQLVVDFIDNMWC